MLIIAIVIGYIALVILIFCLLQFKIWSKKNPVALNIFYALTLLLPYPFEILFFIILRNKYNKATKVVLNRLNKNKFKYHIVFGTFLFAYRDNNFKDTDIDICVYRDEFNQEQSKILENSGFVLEEQWSLDGKIAEQTWINKELNVSMDVFHIGRGKEFAPTFDEKNDRYARRPKAYKYELKEYMVDGIKIFGPKNAEEYLSWNYGTWKNKDNNYHWLYGSSTEPSVIIETKKIEYKKYK